MRELTAEAKCILSLIKAKRSFLLSGGAGSGKTYTLVEVIRELNHLEPSKNIACITYTNAAADEIRDRANCRRLSVSTIHDFLWDNIKRYQVELKQILRELIRSDDPIYKSFSIADGILVEDSLFDDLKDGVQYREYIRIIEGVVSHDEVLILASLMFDRYPKLCRMVKDSYPFIFVDEYQDTSPLVIKLLLDSFPTAPNCCVVGFFGDAMQAIYPGSVGGLQQRVETGTLVEVKKKQNRRNPRCVIDLANQLRSDGLVQHPSDDVTAPNMVGNIVREGVIRFIYSASPELDPVRQLLAWELDGVKELNLTHNLIAAKAGFASLMDIYDGDKILDFVRRIKQYIKENPNEIDPGIMTFGEVVDFLRAGKTAQALKHVSPTKSMQLYMEEHPSAQQSVWGTQYDEISKLYVSKDQLLDDVKDETDDKSRPGSQRDDLIQHLFRIQKCIHAYKLGRYNEFIRLTDFKMHSIRDKVHIQTAVNALENDSTMSIGDAIEWAQKYGIVQIDDRLIRFKNHKKYIYDRVIPVSFSEFQNLYDYLEGHTPFSTQHKTKGREYPKVLVVLDNGGWNNYNFKQLFEDDGSESVRERTAKIFYVCCTRAIEELAVFFHDPSKKVIDKAKEWFGSENVINLDLKGSQVD